MLSLLIPDAHISPSQDLSRFKAASNLITHIQPDNIIIMGDFLTVSSLSHWDDNKRLTMEGKRFELDIEYGNTALNLLLNNITVLNRGRFKHKKRLYKPNIYYLEGNHEAWIGRYCEQHPQMEGFLNLEDNLHLRERQIKLIPYREFLEIDEVLFTHVPMNAANQAVSGTSALRRVMELTAKSTVFAHLHRLECMGFHRHGGKGLIQVLSCGCFFEHPDEYIKEATNHYWKGLIILNHFEPGRFDFKTISIEELKREFL